MNRLPLLPGETVLWEAQPGWRGLAHSVFHIRIVALYFVLLIAANFAAGWIRGVPSSRLIEGEAPVALLAAGASGLLLLFSWLIARSTAFTITTRRVVLRFGIAFPATLSLPLRVIGTVSVRVNNSGSGDILLTLRKGERVGFFRLWPFVHLERIFYAHPLLRAVPAAGAVASLLSRTLQAAQRYALLQATEQTGIPAQLETKEEAIE